MLEKFIDNDVMGFERVLRDIEKIILLIQNLYIKLDPSERGPLSYIAGYIVSKIYQKSKNKKMNAIQSCKHSYER